MRISDWSSDVCSSDLEGAGLVLIDVHRELRSVVESDRADLRDALVARRHAQELVARAEQLFVPHVGVVHQPQVEAGRIAERSEEHTSELQSLMRISYAVFCLKKKTKFIISTHDTTHETRHPQTSEQTTQQHTHKEPES